VYADVKAFQGPTTPINAARAKITVIHIEIAPRSMAVSVSGMAVGCPEMLAHKRGEVDKDQDGESSGTLVLIGTKAKHSRLNTCTEARLKEDRKLCPYLVDSLRSQIVFPLAVDPPA
jgi:hypothetical protein